MVGVLDKKQIEQNIQNHVTYEEAMAKIKRAGLFIPKKPLDIIKGVDLFVEWENVKSKYGGVANIPFFDLGDFLDRWTNMIAYARWTEAIADVEQATAREIKDNIKKQIYTLQEGNREIRDALVYCEPLYVEWQIKFNESYTRYTLIKALREGYEQRAAAISREITRRSSDVIDTRRIINRGDGRLNNC